MNPRSNFFHFHAFSFPLADPSGAQGTHSRVQVLSFSCSYREKNYKIIGQHTHFGIWFPNPQETPGSATVYDFKYVTMECWSTVMETSVIMLSVSGGANKSGK